MTPAGEHAMTRLTLPLLVCGTHPRPAGRRVHERAAVERDCRPDRRRRKHDLADSRRAAYPAYVAAPADAGRHPGLVLLHSFNGLEPGYRTMVDEIAGAGFVVVAPEWQT